MIASSKQGFSTHLEFEGLPPIPVVCRVNARFRSDGTLSVEGEADVGDDFTYLVGVCGRISVGSDRPKIGVRVAAADPEQGVLRFLIRDPAMDGEV